MRLEFRSTPPGRALLGAVTLALFAASGGGFAAGSASAPASAQRWWSHVLFLAGDPLEGRETGSPGYRKAARYVEARMRNAGLEAAGTSGYFQSVRFEGRRIREADSSAAIVRPAGVETLEAGRDFLFRLSSGPAEAVEARLVFVGYGLSIPEQGHDDFKDLDLRGNIAVYLSGAPSSVPGPLAAHAQAQKQRWAALSRAGAVGAIRLLSPLHMERAWEKIADSRSLPSMSLTDAELNDSAGERISMMVNPASAEKLFAGSGHSFA